MDCGCDHLECKGMGADKMKALKCKTLEFI